MKILAKKKLTFQVVQVKSDGKNPFNSRALVFTDATGDLLEADKISDILDLSIGVSVTYFETGRAVSGKFLLPDGTVLMIEQGILKKIIAPK